MRRIAATDGAQKIGQAVGGGVRGIVDVRGGSCGRELGASEISLLVTVSRATTQMSCIESGHETRVLVPRTKETVK